MSRLGGDGKPVQRRFSLCPIFSILLVPSMRRLPLLFSRGLLLAHFAVHNLVLKIEPFARHHTCQAAGAKVAPCKQERMLYLQCSQLGGTEVQEMFNNIQSVTSYSQCCVLMRTTAFGFAHCSRGTQRLVERRREKSESSGTS